MRVFLAGIMLRASYVHRNAAAVIFADNDKHVARNVLVGEDHGTTSQCVSFSLIDAGSVLLPV
jgi:hypothetical protein